MTVHVRKPQTIERAYSLLEVKKVSEDQRIIVGTATTPAPDRMGDIIEPLGVKFTNPMPLLWQHNSRAPVGTVRFDKPTKDGITFQATIPKIDEPGSLKDRVDTAWGEVKAGLVRAVSIGFRSIEWSYNEDTGGMRFLECEVLELSLVTIPANEQATIANVKAIESKISVPVASDHTGGKTNPAGVTAPPNRAVTLEGKFMKKTIAEQIAALEAKRKADSDRMEAVMQKGLDEGRSTEADEQEEFDRLNSEVETIDKDLVRLRALEKIKATQAAPVIKIEDAAAGSAARAGQISVKAPPVLAPGIRFARYTKCLSMARFSYSDAIRIAEARYGDDEPLLTVLKAAVLGGTTISGNWAANLVGAETSVFGDFAAFLRPQTIIGKFGSNGIPGLRSVPFRVPLISQTGGGAGYWVGEGKAKPLTAFDFARTTLTPLKVANIAVLTEESLRDSSPSSEMIVRDSLRDALVARLDIDFVDPAKTASSGISPASITNGATTEASSGTDSDAVRLDARTLFQVFINASNPPTAGVWIMSASNALSLQSMVNPLGQPEFPGITMNGGTFMGLPVITSEYLSTNVILVNASDIYIGDEGGVSIDLSRDASLEMSDAPANEVKTPTAAQLVSMFQTNSVAIRAERTIDWKRRRASAVAYLTGVAWGGAISL